MGETDWGGNCFLFWLVGPCSVQLSSVTQSCLTLSDSMDCSLPGSSAHGIFQARVLKWVAIARQNENHNHRKLIKLITWTKPCLTQWNCEPCREGPPKMDGSWWRVLTKCGPLEKRMAKHFSILALRTSWTVWKGKTNLINVYKDSSTSIIFSLSNVCNKSIIYSVVQSPFYREHC